MPLVSATRPCLASVSASSLDFSIKNTSFFLGWPKMRVIMLGGVPSRDALVNT